MLNMKFRIGTKLALTSGLGVLLVGGMLVTETMGTSSVVGSFAGANSQHVIAEDSSAVKAAARGMMLGVRDVRLAHNSDEIQKAMTYLRAREESVTRLADEALKYIHKPENRERMEKVKSLAKVYVGIGNE